ncbi:hypothetical protein [Edaphobacter dinghuensis]|uniref:hypothetical protein n=1 Tax=Edaphobacter dinghuensis TaxID=1560005 RepID=UPI001668C521|nr:hypothetical protein [Edaphobacter dinghuensis]
MIFVEKEAANPGASATDPRRELVSRVVASSLFAKAERLSTLLLYVCNVALDGRADELSEQNIGEAVFGRSRDYDSANDGIVRAQVSRLRQRLDLYFEGEGIDEPVRIVIPRGGYIPFFEPRPSKEPIPPTSPMPIPGSVDLPVESPHIARSRSTGTAVAWSLVAVLAIVVLLLSLKDLGFFKKAPPTHVATHPLWSQMFIPGQQTTLVLADSNLVVWQGMMKRDVPLEEYLSGNYRTTIPATATPLQKEAVQIAQGRYTSMIDVEMIQYFSQISQLEKSKLDARYTRDLRPNDLKQGNIILSGASEANPWVLLFEHDMNFVFSYDRLHDKSAVINRTPIGNEPREWDSIHTENQHHVYGVVAYLPNLSGNGNVLILEGTTIAGTESALDFVSDDSQLLPFLKQLRRADGSLPHFEVVLGTDNMSGSAVKNSILAWRIKK